MRVDRWAVSVTVTLLVSLFIPAIGLWVHIGGRGVEAYENVFDTPHEHIPNFAAFPTSTSRQSGPWSTPGTWVENRVPTTNDVVLIRLGHEVVYDTSSDVALATMGVEGSLTFRTDINTRLKVGTLLVMPSGKLEIGTLTHPVTPQVTTEIILADHPLYTTTADPNTGIIDPRQYGTALLVLGEITISGAAKTPTWTRLAVEPRAGDVVLKLTEPVSGWRPGDRVVLPDTRHLPVDHPKRADGLPVQTEVLAVSFVDGDQIRLTTPLRFDHKGPRNPDGTPTGLPTGKRLLPHVGNLTRNVVVRSENPSGTRGHMLFTFKAEADIRYAGFYDLGRTTTADLSSTKFDTQGHVTQIGTNQIGRYWVHFHHLWGPTSGTGGRPVMPRGLTPDRIRTWLETNGWQYHFVGNAIAAANDKEHAFKWGIAVHDTRFGKVTDNVLYNIAGSGLQTEDGSESYNLLADNFAVWLPGEGHVRIPQPQANPDIDSDIGKDGSGFWFRGSHNWIECNISADAKFSGHYFSGYYLEDSRIPLLPGADSSRPGEGTTLRLPLLLRFAANEAYGPMQSGLWGAWPSGCCSAMNWQDIQIEGFVAWHLYFEVVKWYHSGKTTFVNLLLRGDPQVMAQPAIGGREMATVGMNFTDYELVELTVRNVDIRGFIVGIDMPRQTQDDAEDAPPTSVVNAVLQNYVNIRVPTAHGGTARKMRIDNAQFTTFTRPPLTDNPQPFNIVMQHLGDDKNSDFATKDTIEVRNYNQVISDNSQVYYLERPAPCTQTRPTIKGFVCATSTRPDTMPPATPMGVRLIQ